jgi:hypothetical protein
VIPIDIVLGCRELVVGGLIGDEHHAAAGEQPARHPQRLDRTRHVVQALEERDHVVHAGISRLTGIPRLERHAVGHAARLGVAARERERLLIPVEAVHPNAGIRPAIAIDDQPVPQPMSATRAGGAARKRSWISGIFGSQSLGSTWR